MKTLFIVLFILFAVHTLTAQTATVPVEKKSTIVSNLNAGAKPS